MTDGPDVPLLGAAEIRALAARHGIRPTKQWGQNFVVDGNTVRRIVRVAGVGADDTVVEVGPGLGSLTLALLPGRRPGGRRRGRPGARRRAARHRGARTRPRWPTGSRWCGADALAVRDLPGPPPTALVANLPYNVSVPVVLRFLELFPTLRTHPGHGAARGGRAAGRAARARAPTACRASRPPGTPTCAWPGSVSRSVFWPVPNVDSGLVTLTRREPPQTPATREEVFACVDAAFAQRRKTLRAALAAWAGSPAAGRGGAAWRPASTRAPVVSSSTSTAFAAIAAARTAARAERA